MSSSEPAAGVESDIDEDVLVAALDKVPYYVHTLLFTLIIYADKMTFLRIKGSLPLCV